MEFKLVHEFQIDLFNQIDLEEEIVRIRWSKENSIFTRDTFVTINVLGTNNKVYRLLRGATSEKIDSNELLVSYSTYKALGPISDSKVSVSPSTFFEKNVLFYLCNPDPRNRHKVIRDFAVTGAGFMVSIIEIIRFIIESSK
jgi:hypothetical protein